MDQVNQQRPKGEIYQAMTDNKRQKILVTGASGFVGGHLVREGIKRGYEVYAGARSSSNLSAFKDLPIKRFPIDLYKADALSHDLTEFAEREGGFDYIVHSAAVTKPKKISEFMIGNAAFTKVFTQQIQSTQPAFKKFILLSSMAARGPGDPTSLKPISEIDEARPNVPYGKSKRQAELDLEQMNDFDYLIFRPTAVYGPYDDKFIGRLIGIIKRGFDISLGSKQQRSSFVFVEDVVDIIFKGLESEVSQELFNISDGAYYNQSQLNQFLKDSLGAKTISVRIPKEVMLSISYLTMMVNGLLGKPTHLSPFKVKELTALNWNVDISKAREILAFKPKYNLKAGIEKSISQWQ